MLLKIELSYDTFIVIPENLTGKIVEALSCATLYKEEGSWNEKKLRRIDGGVKMEFISEHALVAAELVNETD